MCITHPNQQMYVLLLWMAPIVQQANGVQYTEACHPGNSYVRIRHWPTLESIISHLQSWKSEQFLHHLRYVNLIILSAKTIKQNVKHAGKRVSPSWLKSHAHQFEISISASPSLSRNHFMTLQT